MLLWLTGFAALILLWNLFAGGIELAIWVPLGAIAGGVGAAGGAALAALLTPRETDLESVREWSQAAFALPPWEGPLATPAVSVASAAALSALMSGLVAWSVHMYPVDDRARLVVVVNAGLLLVFFVRYTFKVWRAGGCAKGGRLRLMTRRGCGCRGCVWPALL